MNKKINNKYFHVVLMVRNFFSQTNDRNLNLVVTESVFIVSVDMITIFPFEMLQIYNLT